MNIDLTAVKEWLELLHGDSDGFVHVCAAGQWEGFVAESTEQALAYVKTIELRRPSGIYLRATTVEGKLPPGSRGGVKDTKCLPGLWADVDIAGPGHKTTKLLPPTADDAVKMVTESGLPEPTRWIHSGGGLYPWWLLREPWCVQGEEDLETLEALSEHWQDILAHSAEKLGWFYGTETKDLARVLRIPGTINRKVPDSPSLCRLLTDIGSGRLFTVDELFDAITANLPKVQKPERTLPARIVDSGADDLTPGDALENEPWESDLLLGNPHDRWELHHQTGQTSYWTRPGKARRDGYSATTGYDSGRDRLYVFSSATVLPTQEPLTKFAVYTHLNHGGDYSAAAASLRKMGMGGREVVEVPAVDVWNPDLPPAQPTPTASWSRFSWDDLGNAQRFALRYRDRLRWLIDTEGWALFLGGRWSQITEAPANTFAQKLVEELPRLELSLYSDEPTVAGNGKQMPSEQEQFISWVNKQRAESRMTAMRRCATGRPELHAKLGDFDQDPMLLNCHNGVLDLRTGSVSPPNSELLLMQQADVTWDEDADCPLWLEYLEKVMPSPDARTYLQQLTGYSLTADVSERVMFLHHGGGDNGKSIYLDVIGTILGSYSIVIAADTLMAKQFQGNHNADVARMAGRRFLRASETNVGKHLDEGQVKLLAGGDDMIVARYPYQRFPFEFRPTGKIHLATNHPPEVSDSDSIWRRLRLVSWNVRIPLHEQNRYLTKQLLKAERAGILKWAVQGCLDWLSTGLKIPDSLQLQEMELRDSQSVVRQFIYDCVKNVEGNRETFSRIYAVYRLWCDQNGARPMSGKALSMALHERGYRRWRDGGTRGFIDMMALTPMQREMEWQP